MGRRTSLPIALSLLAGLGLVLVEPAKADHLETEEEQSQAVCVEALGTDCNPSQARLLKQLMQDLDMFSVSRRLQRFKGEVPALHSLPRDKFGFINWTRALSRGLIAPVGSLTGNEKEYEPYLANLMLFQAKVQIMADVVFPHGMHTYWLDCASCHPDPFPEKRGGTKMVMKEMIRDGKWCGKCHGKVAFPFASYENCRRCHAIKKQPY